MADIMKAIEEMKKEGYTAEEILLLVAEAFSNATPKAESKVRGKISEEELFWAITKLLHQMGIPAHIKGYQYIRDAIQYVIKNPLAIEAVIKELYPAIAKMHNTTPTRVERAIRHAIEVAWERGDPDVLNSYFEDTISCERGKPTNSEFIAMIADHFRLRLN